MIVNGNILKVRCTKRNRDGHQCGNLMWTDEAVCYIHRQAPLVGTRLSPDQGSSIEQEIVGS